MTLLPLVAAALAAEPSIPFEQYELDNGLDVILAQDRSTPIVHVNVWYHVGAKDEEPGRSGFAHLFEHLMFQGSGSVEGEYFAPLQAVGADVNGTTNLDRTNYFETVPSQFLPLALFLESDRMGTLLERVDQANLDNQRDVVRNERRQRYEVPPYGETWVVLHETLFPEGHPYHHTTIGSHEDLEAATLDDVHSFFKTWYVPNNASLVVSGDFDVATAKRLIEENFGWIPRGDDPTPVSAEAIALPDHVEVRKFAENVPHQKLWVAWLSPAVFEPGDSELDLLSSVLADGADSRLHQAFVTTGLAQSARAYQVSSTLQSMYVIELTAAKGHSTDELLTVLDTVLEGIRTESPPTVEELEAAKAQYELMFFGALTGIRGKGNLLNRYNFAKGDPGYIAQDLNRYLAADSAAVLQAARDVTTGNRLTLHYWPESDRPKPPMEEPAPLDPKEQKRLEKQKRKAEKRRLKQEKLNGGAQ